MLKEIVSVNFKGINGGCYCYCFKYPIRAIDQLNPRKLIGQRENATICRIECDQPSNQALGYFEFSKCTSTLQREVIPSAAFLALAMIKDRLGTSSLF